MKKIYNNLLTDYGYEYISTKLENNEVFVRYEKQGNDYTNIVEYVYKSDRPEDIMYYAYCVYHTDNPYKRYPRPQSKDFTLAILDTLEIIVESAKPLKFY